MFLISLTQFLAASCGKPKLLGIFVPWYQYLTVGNVALTKGQSYCGVTGFTLLGSGSDLPLVLLAIIDDLIRLAGLIAVGYVIYGGVQYATSQGSPDQTAKAQSTIINALVGLAIALIAVATVSYIGSKIGANQ